MAVQFFGGGGGDNQQTSVSSGKNKTKQNSLNTHGLVGDPGVLGGVGGLFLGVEYVSCPAVDGGCGFHDNVLIAFSNKEVRAWFVNVD